MRSAMKNDRGLCAPPLFPLLSAILSNGLSDISSTFKRVGFTLDRDPRSRKDPSLSLRSARAEIFETFSPPSTRYSRERRRMDGWMDGWMDRSARTDVVVHRSRLLIFASRESKQIEIPGAPFSDMNIRAISAFCAVI